MKFLKALAAVGVLFLTCVTPVLAAEEVPMTEKEKAEVAVAEKRATNWSIALGAGLGAGITIVGAGYGISAIAGRAVESMARQPEMAGNIQGAMIISAALIEGVTFFSLIVCILVLVLI